MRPTSLAMALFGVGALVATARADNGQQALKERLRAIAAGHYAVPADAFPLALEMTKHIGASDGELRDDLIWRTFKEWIVRRSVFRPDQLKALLAIVRDDKHLFHRLGERGDNSVFVRAFSVLVVEQVLIAHRRSSFLSVAEVQRVKDDVLRYFAGERDLRGYVSGKGWAHAVAHAADALAQLAQCRETREGDLREVLAVLRAKAAVVEAPYVHDEDERMVTAALAVLQRRALTEAEVIRWIDSFAEFERAEWFPENYQALNKKGFLRSLYFRAGGRPEAEFVRRPIEQALAQLGDSWE